MSRLLRTFDHNWRAIFCYQRHGTGAMYIIKYYLLTAEIREGNGFPEQVEFEKLIYCILVIYSLM